MRGIPGPPSRRRAWVASAYALLLAGCFFPARRAGEIGPVRPAVACAAAPPPRVVRFDRPFLLALLRRGASRPYLLAWFGNDDLFVKG